MKLKINLIRAIKGALYSQTIILLGMFIYNSNHLSSMLRFISIVAISSYAFFAHGLEEAE